MGWKRIPKMLSFFHQKTENEANVYRSPNLVAIHDILHEWQQTYAFWQMINDPDLIDAAIFRINAAEKQYLYLLKKEEKEQREWIMKNQENIQEGASEE